jgi:hypothetical protein
MSRVEIPKGRQMVGLGEGDARLTGTRNLEAKEEAQFSVANLKGPEINNIAW